MRLSKSRIQEPCMIEKVICKVSHKTNCNEVVTLVLHLSFQRNLVENERARIRSASE